MATALSERIADLVKRSPDQMRTEEYTAVAESLLSVAPRHALVFGCGRDSELWCSLMPAGGVIAFVEDNIQWATSVPAPVVVTRYKGTVERWREQDPLAIMDCAPIISRVPWDWILIDGPRGDLPKAPGRLGPIHFASNRDAVVLVHDCHRDLEQGACDTWLPRPFRAVHHLRLYDRP
jgi:IRX15/GXM family protein